MWQWQAQRSPSTWVLTGQSVWYRVWQAMVTVSIVFMSPPYANSVCMSTALAKSDTLHPWTPSPKQSARTAVD